MRSNVMFPGAGTELAGLLFTPDDADGEPSPAVAAAHGFSCVKEQGLEPVARALSDAGITVLLFDNPHLGAAGGEPRGRIDPMEQVQGYADALTWLADRPDVDPRRLGAWGTSYSGGIVIRLATIDRRVRAIVAQVPFVLNAGSSIIMDPGPTGILSRLIRAAESRPDAFGAGEGYIPVTAREGEIGVLAGEESYAAFAAPEWAAPSWRNRITVDSLRRMRDFDPLIGIENAVGVAALMIAAERDSLVPLSAVRDAFERWGGPKAVSVMPCAHYDVYRSPWRDEATRAAVRWFRERL